MYSIEAFFAVETTNTSWFLRYKPSANFFTDTSPPPLIYGE